MTRGDQGQRIGPRQRGAFTVRDKSHSARQLPIAHIANAAQTSRHVTIESGRRVQARDHTFRCRMARRAPFVSPERFASLMSRHNPTPRCGALRFRPLRRARSMGRVDQHHRSGAGCMTARAAPPQTLACPPIRRPSPTNSTCRRVAVNCCLPPVHATASVSTASHASLLGRPDRARPRLPLPCSPDSLAYRVFVNQAVSLWKFDIRLIGPFRKTLILSALRRGSPHWTISATTSSRQRDGRRRLSRSCCAGWRPICRNWLAWAKPMKIGGQSE